MTKPKHPAAVALGSLGGKRNTPAQVAARLRNALMPVKPGKRPRGRPRKEKAATADSGNGKGANAKWFKHVMGCGTVRHRLFVGDQETPWFIDKAQVRAHFTNGQPVGLFAAGASPSGTAACAGGFNNVRDAKAVAISKL